MSKKQDEILNSSYDGIQEYDNDLPKWWLVLFYITIAFAVVYSIFYFSGMGLNSADRLKSELSEIDQNKQLSPASPQVDDTVLRANAKDANHLAAGKAVFTAKCLACHGPEGQGLVGPNLTDEYWIHGGSVADIRKTVMEGVLDKGMLAWKTMLSPQEINDVVSFVYSLRGSTPANPKAPQGEKYVGNE